MYINTIYYENSLYIIFFYNGYTANNGYGIEPLYWQLVLDSILPTAPSNLLFQFTTPPYNPYPSSNIKINSKDITSIDKTSNDRKKIYMH